MSRIAIIKLAILYGLGKHMKATDDILELLSELMDVYIFECNQSPNVLEIVGRLGHEAEESGIVEDLNFLYFLIMNIADEYLQMVKHSAKVELFTKLLDKSKLLCVLDIVDADKAVEFTDYVNNYLRKL
jgi:hypothetical protein